MLGTKILEEKESKYNGKLRVVRTFGMGTYLQAGGLTQSGGIVETIWKQTLRRVKSEEQDIKSCLILGLGGGTVAKLVRRKWPEANITGVDIDSAIVELGKKYLGLDQVNVDIKIQDAFDHFSNHQSLTINYYDLIIIDLYQGDKFPDKFETGKYIDIVKSHLSENGLAVFNRLYYGEKRPQAVKFGRKLEKIFTKVDWFYPEANLMFLCSM
jgi:spermidine synthase